MVKDKKHLYHIIDMVVESPKSRAILKDAVDDYSSALIAAKPIVSGSGSVNIVATVRHYCPDMVDYETLDKDFNKDLLAAWKYITDDEHPAGYSDTWELVAVDRY